MKKNFLLMMIWVFTFALLHSETSFAILSPTPRVFSVVPEKIFIPGGFDDNDRVQLILRGNLLNTCEKVGPIQTQIDKKNKKISINQKVFAYAGDWCVQMIIPFTQTIDLGMLEVGEYQVVSIDKFGTELTVGLLPIAPNQSPNADDFLYAPVEQIFIENNSTGHGNTLTLSGNFPNQCMKIKEIKILERTAQVIEILPITEVTQELPCENKQIKFKSQIQLKDLPKGITLLHVRTMNGKAINQVVSVD